MPEVPEPYKFAVWPQKYSDDSFRLFVKIKDSGWRPDFINAVWRGGAAAFLYITDAAKREGMEFEDMSVKVSSYIDIGKQSKFIKIVGIESVIDEIHYHRSKRILIGDDVFDTGKTCHALKTIMEKGLFRKDAIDAEERRNSRARMYRFEFDTGIVKYHINVPMTHDIEPVDAEIELATVYTKRHANLTNLFPRFSVEDFEPIVEDGKEKWPWIVFPHEVRDLKTNEELRAYFPSAYEILVKKNSSRS